MASFDNNAFDVGSFDVDSFDFGAAVIVEPPVSASLGGGAGEVFRRPKRFFPWASISDAGSEAATITLIGQSLIAASGFLIVAAGVRAVFVSLIARANVGIALVKAGAKIPLKGNDSKASNVAASEDMPSIILGRKAQPPNDDDEALSIILNE